MHEWTRAPSDRVKTGHLEGPLWREMDLRYLAGPLKKGEKRRGGGGGGTGVENGKESEEGRGKRRREEKRREGREGVECVHPTRVQPSHPFFFKCAEFIVVPRVRYDSRPMARVGRKSCSIGATAAYPHWHFPLMLSIKKSSSSHSGPETQRAAAPCPEQTRKRGGEGPTYHVQIIWPRIIAYLKNFNSFITFAAGPCGAPTIIDLHFTLRAPCLRRPTLAPPLAWVRGRQEVYGQSHR